MRGISIAVFAILVCSANALQNQFREEKKYFNTFLEQVVYSGFQMDIFVDIMWPTIQEVLPEPVALPAAEVVDPVTDQYLCVTNTTIHARLGELLGRRQLGETEKVITYEVEAELFLDAPVEMAVGTSLDDHDTPPVHVSYSFKQPSKVKFVLDVVNVLNMNVPPPGCIIRIVDIRIDWLSRPETISKQTVESAKKIEQLIRSSFKYEGAKEIGTAGLVRAVKKWITNTPNYWICSSPNFDKMVEVSKGKWQYSKNYDIYCLNKGKSNQ